MARRPHVTLLGWLLTSALLAACSSQPETPAPRGDAADPEARALDAASEGRAARIEACEPLQFEAPSPPGELPRPRRLRAASSVVPFAGGLAVVQDDARFLGLLRGDDALAIVLPSANGAPGALDEGPVRKKDKLDLEAAVHLPATDANPSRLVVLGSGSTKRRTWIATIDEASLASKLLDGRALYERLRELPALGGAKLNVEGAIVDGERLRLFHRANGKRRGPASLVLDLDRAAFARWLDDAGAVPDVRAAEPVDLGAVDGVPFGFTDAARHRDTTVFIAVAEASADAVADGPIRGARIGTLDARGAEAVDVVEPNGEPSRRKLEGLAFDPSDPSLLVAVTDPDDAEAAAERCSVRLHGFF